jgi:hypothetical protein
MRHSYLTTVHGDHLAHAADQPDFIGVMLGQKRLADRQKLGSR